MPQVRNFLSHHRNVFIQKMKTAFNVFVLSPDRFLAIFALIITLSFVFYDLPSVTCLFDNPLKIFIALIVILIFSIWLSFYSSRFDPKLYAKIISEGIDINIIIKKICKECLDVISDIKKEKGENIFLATSKLSLQLQIIEESKKILSARFGMTPIDFCDHFLCFSPSVYKSRQHQRAFIEKDERIENDASLIELNRINGYGNDSNDYLKELSETKLDFSQMSHMFKANSTLVEIQHFVTLLGSIQNSLEEKKLLYKLQRSKNNGNILNKLVALTVIGLKAKLSDDFRELYPEKLWENQLRYLCLDKNVKLSDESFNNWSHQISKLLLHLYGELSEELKNRLIEIIDKHAINPSKRIYIVTREFSKVSEAAIAKIIEKYRGRGVDIGVFLLTGGVESSKLNTRIMYHELTNENFGGKIFEEKVSQGDINILKARLRMDKCHLIYITGCTGYSKKKNVIATLQHPDEMKELSRKSSRSINVIALAGAHKEHISDLELVGELEEQLIKNINSYLPNRQWEGFYVWNDLDIITN